MKKVTLLFFLLCGSIMFGQVGIGTINPDPSSQLEVAASNKGILIPRINIENLDTAAPVNDTDIKESLLVYNTNTNTGKGFYYWTGVKWERMINTQEVLTFINSIPDDQQLMSFDLVGNTLSLTLEDGGTKSIDLSPLAGKSAYEQWIEDGNSGSEADFLNSLKGDKGDDGKSAYEVWLETNPGGTPADYAAAIKGDKGDDGKSAYEVWLETNAGGTPADYAAAIKGDKGDDGKSAYEV